MSRLRWLTMTLALPLLYIAVLYRATRPPKPVYTFPARTVMTVSDKGGPAAAIASVVEFGCVEQGHGADSFQWTVTVISGRRTAISRQNRQEHYRATLSV